MTSSSGQHNRRIAFLLGVAVTAVVAAAGYAQVFRDVELAVYDRQFAWARPSARGPDCGAITHVDIDDASLTEYGRWPWPRAQLARVVDELSRLDAREIVLDVIMPEPQTPRPEQSPYGKHHDLLGQERYFGQWDQSGYLFDDTQLAEAIQRSGRVFLSMHFEPRPADQPPPPPLNPQSIDGPLPESLLLGPQGERLVSERLAALLAKDPSLTAVQAAAAIHPPSQQEAGPIQDLILPCYRRLRAMRLLDGQSSVPSSELLEPATWPAASSAAPPIPALAQSAGGVGFVSFGGDKSEGVLRALPPLMRYNGRLYPQLGVLVACHAMDVPLDRLRVQDGELVLPEALGPDGGRRTIRVPLDEQRRLWVNWHFNSPRWQDSFTHLPIRDVLAVARNRQLIDEHELRLLIASANAVAIAGGDDATQQGAYVRMAQFAIDLMRQRQRQGRLDPALEVQLTATQADLAAMAPLVDRARGRFTERRESLSKLAQPSDAQREELREINALADALHAPLFSPEQVRAEIESLRRRVARQEERTRPLVAGRICFVGSTATGAADFVATPVFPQTPGVVVHSNIVNMLLTGRFIRQAPGWMNLLAIVVCGLTASAITARMGPRLGTLLIFAVAVALLGFKLLVMFERLHLSLAIVGPLVAIFLIWGFVTGYRQLTEERQRRWVTRALGSYTSPSVAKRVAEQPDLLSLAGEQREITCMFTDLQGFTPISEGLGPEQTVTLLNRYLNRMTESLLPRGATINKFLGDGVFAFFGAPDLQLDHARRAVAAALDCRSQLVQLNAELQAEGQPPLGMRIGLASGSAIVGNCGSARKFDYTAIGDTVNLASRLEAANKFFGTSIILSGPTADQLDDGFLLRPLGEVVVVGKQQAVRVYELLDALPDASPELRRWAAQFAAAVGLYRKRRFDDALAALEKLAGERDDRPTQIYIDLCRQARGRALPADWSPAVVLSQK